jgi:hypothetical protein
MSCCARYLILASFVCIPEPAPAQDQALTLAQGLYQAGNYQDAITENLRLICFNSDSSAVSDAYERIALCYRQLGDWDDAVTALRRSVTFSRNDSLREERRVAIGVTLIAGRQYSAAEEELLRISTFGKRPSVKRKAGFFRGVAAIYTYKWDEARMAFATWLADAGITERNALDSLLGPARRPGYRSPSRAKLLSSILPGAGQVYVGDWRNGLDALILNAATGYLLVDRVLARDFAMTIVTTVPLFLRYYEGSRQRAAELAMARNERVNQQLAKRILSVLDTHARSDAAPGDSR